MHLKTDSSKKRRRANIIMEYPNIDTRAKALLAQKLPGRKVKTTKFLGK